MSLHAGGSAHINPMIRSRRPVEISTPYRIPLLRKSILVLMRSGVDMCRHGDGVQGVREQPRRPQDHPLLGPRRELGLRPCGTHSVDPVYGFFPKPVQFGRLQRLVYCNCTYATFMTVVVLPRPIWCCNSVESVSPSPFPGFNII